MSGKHTHSPSPRPPSTPEAPSNAATPSPRPYLVGDAAGQEQVGAGGERRPHLLAAGCGQGMRHLPQRLGPGGRERLRGSRRAARHRAGAGQRPRQGRRERRPRRLGEKLRGRGRSLPATAAMRRGAGGGGCGTTEEEERAQHPPEPPPAPFDSDIRATCCPARLAAGHRHGPAGGDTRTAPGAAGRAGAERRPGAAADLAESPVGRAEPSRARPGRWKRCATEKPRREPALRRCRRTLSNGGLSARKAILLL